MSIASDKIERCSAQMLMLYPWWASLYLHLVRIEIEYETGEVERGRTFALNVRIIRTAAQTIAVQRGPQ